MASNSWSISSDPKRAVPRKSMCSTRCDRPASASPSADEPVPTQKPSATDRTESMDSVTTRTPDSSRVRRCPPSPTGALPALGVAPAAAAVARAARAARAAAVAAALAPVAIAPRAAVAPAAPAAARPDAGQLLDRLAGDLRVGGQAQADAAALAVDLDDAHLDLVALVEDVLDRVDPLAGRHVGDVQQAVGALGQLDERAERRRLDDLAGVLVADLDLLGHRADALGQRLAQLTAPRVHEHLAVVVDVDLGLELVRQPADRLAALADEQADLVGVDLHREDARRMRREARPRGVDD